MCLDIYALGCFSEGLLWPSSPHPRNSALIRQALLCRRTSCVPPPGQHAIDTKDRFQAADRPFRKIFSMLGAVIGWVRSMERWGPLPLRRLALASEAPPSNVWWRPTRPAGRPVPKSVRWRPTPGWPGCEFPFLLREPHRSCGSRHDYVGEMRSDHCYNSPMHGRVSVSFSGEWRGAIGGFQESRGRARCTRFTGGFEKRRAVTLKISNTLWSRFRDFFRHRLWAHRS